MSPRSLWPLALAIFTSVLALASSPHIDFRGVVKGLDDTTVTLETHGQNVEIPRASFENQEALEVGGNAKARVDIKDLSKIKSAHR